MTNETMTYKYLVIDGRTGLAVGIYTSSKRARRHADKLDLEYGAIRYSVKEVSESKKS